MPARGKYAEIADAEATDDAEPDPDAAERDADPAPAVAGEIAEDGTVTGAPAEPDTGNLEASLRAFEKENARHERELRKIMGDDFEAFEPCPGCASVGFRPDTAMQFDPDTEQCPRCKGHGMMLSGSVNEMNVLRPCTDCAGNGFVVKVRPPETPTQPAAAVPRFDLYTGAPIEAGSQPATNPDGTPWAPGYVPPGQPAPAAR